ncbi:MAG: peptidoglycan-binding protein [Acidobacteriaceae bacterium]|nr:peptidoglycan-binding protein [Acidobacteriaceae bacterium]
MRVLILLLLGAASVLLQANPQAKTKSQPAPSGTKRRSVRSRVRRQAAPVYQLHPDPERYQEIQRALADRGYFHGEVNGIWGDDSVDALKRFQADQKLEPDGKITALSLIGLGLGPKHEATTALPLSGSTAAPASAPAASTPNSTAPTPGAPPIE